MTTPLIEAIARAICANTGGFAWECAPDDTKDGCLGDAQAALTAITEAGYEICPKGTMAALDASRVAIDDWLNIYAHDMCDEQRVKEARVRIFESGGTLAYIARIQEHNRSISAAQGDG